MFDFGPKIDFFLNRLNFIQRLFQKFHVYTFLDSLFILHFDIILHKNPCRLIRKYEKRKSCNDPLLTWHSWHVIVFTRSIKLTFLTLESVSVYSSTFFVIFKFSLIVFCSNVELLLNFFHFDVEKCYQKSLNIESNSSISLK